MNFCRLKRQVRAVYDLSAHCSDLITVFVSVLVTTFLFVGLSRGNELLTSRLSSNIKDSLLNLQCFNQHVTDAADVTDAQFVPTRARKTWCLFCGPCKVFDGGSRCGGWAL